MIYSPIIILFFLLATLSQLILTCNIDPNCQNLRFLRILIGKYSPHIKFTYQRNDTLRISGQPSTRDEANDNLTGAINRAVQRIKNSIAPKVEVVPVQLLTNSEIGEFPLHRNGNKFTKVTCFPFGDIKWGSVKDSLRVIIEKSSIQEGEYFEENGYFYRYTSSKVNNREETWLRFVVNLEFKKSAHLPKMCEAHWSYLMGKLEKEMAKDIRIKELEIN